MRLSIAVFAALSIASAGEVHADVPLTCQVDARSTPGGRVRLSTFDHSDELPFDMPPRLNWQPPSSGGGIELNVGWQNDRAIGELTGGYVRFTPRVEAAAGRYSVRIAAGAGEVWTYGPDKLEAGDEQTDVVLNRDDPWGSAILTAIGHGRRMTVDVLLDGKIEQSDTFDPSNTAERDKLAAYAGHLADIKDPRVCKPI